MATSAAQPPRPGASGGDRHKPRRLVGISERICKQFDKLALDREAKLTELVKNACIDYLTRAGLWPPASK